MALIGMRKRVMMFRIDSRLKENFPELKVLVCQVKGVKVEKRSARLEKFKEKLMKQVKEQYNLESLKDVSTFRAYRDFFWRVGIDPLRAVQPTKH